MIEVKTYPKYLIRITEFDKINYPEKSFFIIEKKISDFEILNPIYEKKNYLIYEGGENTKTLESVLELIKILDTKLVDRKTLFVLIGGGAFLDKVGFALSIFHRGTSIIKIPTTLLAQVDAGIGVKNGINFLNQKNLLGCFKIPDEIIVDTRFLKNLDVRQIRSGLAEAIKISLIRDKDLFLVINNKYNKYIQKDFRDDEIIKRTIIAHIRQIEKDPFEDKIARPLDFGHEWGHRIEVLSNHRYNHGEAISIGMAIDSVISFNRGYISREELMKILRLFKKIGLPYKSDYKWDELWIGLEHFRKHLGGLLTITLLKGIGEGIDVNEITKKELEDAIKLLNNLNI